MAVLIVLIVNKNKKMTTTSMKKMMIKMKKMMIIVAMMDIVAEVKATALCILLAIVLIFLLFTADYYSFHGRIPFGYSPLINSYSYATGSAIPGLVRQFLSFISNPLNSCRLVNYEPLNV